MVALAVEPTGGALESPRELTPRRVPLEIRQQRPAPQPQLGRTLMAVQAPARAHPPTQPVHRPIDRVARAMASRLVVCHRVGLRLVHKLRQHHEHRGGPRLRGTPLRKLAHLAAELLCVSGPVDVPHLAVQFVGLATALADLQEPVQETEDYRDPRKARLERIPRRRLAIYGDRLGSVVGFGLPQLGREDAVGLEMALSVEAVSATP